MDALPAAASDHERDMLGRTSLPLLGALPLAVLALAGCGGNASHALPTTNNGRPASIGVASTGLGDVLVGLTARPDGISQLTYNGHPLYTFVNDNKPGDTNGEGINAFGGSWFAVSPAGAKVGPRSQPQGGGGYGGY